MMKSTQNLIDLVSGMDCSVLRVSEHHSPATDYPLEQVGKARLFRGHYKADNLYIFEGVDGYDFMVTDARIPVTSLGIDGKEWMVDDPLHWRGMQGLARASHGRVLVGGLGLGLVLHALMENPNVKLVDVVEREPDVIKLMKNKIPRKVTIIEGDIYEKIMKEELPRIGYDTVILDTWVGGKGEVDPNEMLGSAQVMKYKNPGADVFIWGVLDPKVNPAVTKTLCEAAQKLKGII